MDGLMQNPHNKLGRQPITSEYLLNVMQGKHREFFMPDEWIEIDGYRIEDSFMILRPITFEHKIRIINCTFSGHFSICNGHFLECVEWDNCKYSKMVFLSGGSYEKSVAFKRVDTSHVSIDGGSYKTFDFSSNNTNLNMWIQGGEFEVFEFGKYIGENSVEKLTIYNQGKLKGKLIFVNKNINQVSILGSNLDCSYSFENIKSQYFHISSFHNHGELNFFGITPLIGKRTYFEIVKSNLGKAQLHRILFKEFDEVIILDSYFSEINTINCEWAKDNFIALKGPTYGNYNKERNAWGSLELSQLKEVFRQFKYLYEKQGDKINEQFFYGLEMNIYNRQLAWKSPHREVFWQKLILLFSRYLTNYGSSFLRPLIGLLTVNQIVLLILIIFFNHQGLSFVAINEGTAAGFSQAFGEYCILLNPLHKMREDIGGFEILWDLISRISSSYFIYALIKSSRRFVR